MSVGQLEFEDLGSVAALRENYDVELKSAQGRDGSGAVPDSIWETYSAFANTKGGWLVLGVEEADSGLEILGISDFERVQKEIWDTLNDAEKISANILQNKDVRIVEEEGKNVVVVKVPAASRRQRPVYIGENPLRGTYLRNFEGDYQADESVVRRMLAEAEAEARDSETLPNYGLDDLDEESIEKYRNLFQSTKPQHSFLEGSTEELLRNLGGMKLNRERGSLELTVAGLLMFGNLVSIRDRFPHYNLDYQERSEGDPSRWSDRVTTDGSWAGNLFQFFRRVLPKLTSDIKVPFRLNDDMRRVDETEVTEALREALVNTLIHADYEATTPIRVVKGENGFEFRNPGRLRVPKEQALAGGVSDCRNPSIQGPGEVATTSFR